MTHFCLKNNPPHIYNEKIIGFSFYDKWVYLNFEGDSSVGFPLESFKKEIFPQLRKRGIVEANSIEELMNV